MRIYRDIAALAGAQVVCFLLLSHWEPAFFLLHFYQTIVYVAILIMLFYMEDRWAYMIGIVAPAVWLAMTFATGLLGASVRQFLHLERSEGITNEVSFLADGPPKRHVPAYQLWDVHAAFTVGRNVKLLLGVENLFNTAPPLSITGDLLGYDPLYGDPRGRRWTVGLRASWP